MDSSISKLTFCFLEVKHLCVDIVSVWKDAVKIDERQGAEKTTAGNAKTRLGPAHPSSVDKNLERSSSEDGDSPAGMESPANQRAEKKKKPFPSPRGEAGLFEKLLSSGDTTTKAPPPVVVHTTPKPRKRTAKTLPTKFRSTGRYPGGPDTKIRYTCCHYYGSSLCVEKLIFLGRSATLTELCCLLYLNFHFYSHRICTIKMCFKASMV